MMDAEGPSTIYGLWDVPSRNLIAVFHAEDEALAAIRTFIKDDGEESIEGVVLIRQEPDGSGDVIAADAALARLAQERRHSSHPTD
jgi:hypothetical protein